MHRTVLPVLVLSLAAGLPVPARGAGEPPPDLLSREMDRWEAALRTSASTDELGKQVEAGAGPVLARARSALGAGRRLLALQRFLAARAELSAAAYLQAGAAAGVKEAAAFEAEWTRMGTILADRLATPRADALAGVGPAALRAIGEAALPQSRIFYDASLEYGRATMPGYGLYYLGSARSAGETVELCRALSQASGAPPAPVRSIGSEISALEGELLAAYRPPLSVDRHPDFIAASSQLKEARELDELGLGHGALLRFLLAAQRFAPLREGAGTATATGEEGDGLARRLRDLEGQLGTRDDHSLGRLFLERAQEALTAQPPETEVARAIADDVLPRYLDAVGPARPQPPREEPRFTVTLVRWPYT
jgi:hypothetical protein